MKIFHEDFVVEIDADEKIKDVFQKCISEGFVLPIIPVFDVSFRKAFEMDIFPDRIFGFPQEHFICGFEMLWEGRRIKYGGKIYKTNTGLNITPMIFSSGTLIKILVRLLPRAKIIIYELKEDEDKDPKLLHEAKFIISDRKLIKCISDSPFSLYDFQIELPGNTDLLSLIPQPIQEPTVREKIERNKVFRKIKENEKFVLVSKGRYFFLFY